MRGREEAPSFFTEDVLEHVLKFITEPKARNNVSLVCKAWYMVEAQSRSRIFIGNCYAVSPERLIERFPKVVAITLKGKPRFADFGLLPSNWGAHALLWVQALCKAYPSSLEELRMKRMTVCNDSLAIIATQLTNFKSLTLIACDGFSSDGLTFIASHCKSLRCLDLLENKVDDLSSSFVNQFQESCTSLTSLNLENVQDEVDFDALLQLVTRCTTLTSLKLNRSISLSQLQVLLRRVPQLIELGTGSFLQEISSEELLQIQSCLSSCKNLRTLSGFWEVAQGHLSIIYPVCRNLLFLNLSYTPVSATDLVELAGHCFNLQRLWVLDSVEDTGLRAFTAVCKDLRDIRVYPSEGQGGGRGVSEEGLVSIAEGCPELTSILYICGQMTNHAIAAMARNCPKLESFRLATLDPSASDCVTNQPMDEGFGAIVRACSNLRRLGLSGLLTDRVFEHIGLFGKRLERLSLAFAGGSDLGLQCVLQGCTSLSKLEIRDSSFGDDALLAGAQRYESMRSLWMSACRVTMRGCTSLALLKPHLVVEVIKRRENDNPVEILYVYPSVAGPRQDVPPFVTIL